MLTTKLHARPNWSRVTNQEEFQERMFQAQLSGKVLVEVCLVRHGQSEANKSKLLFFFFCLTLNSAWLAWQRSAYFRPKFDGTRCTTSQRSIQRNQFTLQMEATGKRSNSSYQFLFFKTCFDPNFLVLIINESNSFLGDCSLPFAACDKNSRNCVRLHEGKGYSLDRKPSLSWTCDWLGWHWPVQRCSVIIVYVVVFYGKPFYSCTSPLV